MVVTSIFYFSHDVLNRWCAPLNSMFANAFDFDWSKIVLFGKWLHIKRATKSVHWMAVELFTYTCKDWFFKMTFFGIEFLFCWLQTCNDILNKSQGRWMVGGDHHADDENDDCSDDDNYEVDALKTYFYILAYRSFFFFSIGFRWTLPSVL